MVALLPPFVDARAPIVPQLVVLALVAAALDVAIGAVYILAGSVIIIVAVILVTSEGLMKKKSESLVLALKSKT